MLPVPWKGRLKQLEISSFTVKRRRLFSGKLYENTEALWTPSRWADVGEAVKRWRQQAIYQLSGLDGTCCLQVAITPCLCSFKYPHIYNNHSCSHTHTYAQYRHLRGDWDSKTELAVQQVMQSTSGSWKPLTFSLYQWQGLWGLHDLWLHKAGMLPSISHWVATDRAVTHSLLCFLAPYSTLSVITYCHACKSHAAQQELLHLILTPEIRKIH